MISLLLVSRPGVVKENAVEVFHHYGVQSLWCSLVLFLLDIKLQGKRYYQISREKFRPEPGLELGPPDL